MSFILPGDPHVPPAGMNELVFSDWYTNLLWRYSAQVFTSAGPVVLLPCPLCGTFVAEVNLHSKIHYQEYADAGRT